MHLKITHEDNTICFELPETYSLQELCDVYSEEIVFNLAMAEIKKKAIECARYHAKKGMSEKDIVFMMEKEWSPGTRIAKKRILSEAELKGIDLLEGLLK